MKIALCLFKYYPFGGLERDFLNIATALERCGHEIHIYTMKWQGDIPENFNVNLLKINGHSNHKRALSFSNHIKKIKLTKQYDVIIGFQRMAGLDFYFAADVCFARSAQQKHGFWYRLTPRYRHYLQLEKMLMQSAATILHLSPFEKRDYQYYYNVPDARFQALTANVRRNDKDKQQMQAIKNRVRQVLKVNPQEHMLLMVGSDYKRKGVARALHALAAQQSPQIKLFIAGKGKVKPMLKLTRSLGLNSQVIFLGARDDVADLMCAADVLLHLAHEETAGKVILEALTFGLPVLVTENCGYAFHVKNAQAGELIRQPAQQANLNQTLKQFLQADLSFYRTNALKYAANTDMYSMLEQIVQLVESRKPAAATCRVTQDSVVA
ncbi:MAG: glycosyltransferase family 4 protein [Pseudomonadota bacterium]